MNKINLPKIKLVLLRKALILIFIISFSFSSGYVFGNAGYSASIKQFPKVTINRETPKDKGILDFNLFWKIWDTLNAKYYDRGKLIPSEMVYGAIRGMVASVGDPYTVFLPPEENKIVQEDLQGNFEGAGIQIGFKGNQLVVIAPIQSSPAEKAGVKAGDFIIGIKDESKNLEIGTVGITLPEAVQAIRGPAGSKVTLFLTRDGKDEPIETEITRASIDVPSVTIDFLGEGEKIAHIKILKFATETLDEWDNSVTEVLKKPEIKAVVIDVRNNPGGFMQGAVDLASDFLDQSEVVVIEEDGSGTKEEFRVEKLGRLRNYKSIVLINQGSASASEIFAGALRDDKKIKLVGETSFGKGTIQEPQQINGGLGLHITISKWLTPSGFWVNDGGLKPDIEVKDNPDTEEDEQLQKAIDEVLK